MSAPDLISSFVPQSVARAEPQAAASDDAVSMPFEAVVLLIDISGFTAMTERFERSGPAGVEQLTAALADHFGTMIARILAAGGEIENLLGDALLAFWPVAAASSRDTAATALNTALAIQRALSDQRVDDDTAIEVHAALALGPVTGLHLGGHDDHRLFLLRGEPLDQVAAHVDTAGPGQVVVDSAVRAALGPAIDGELRADGSVLVTELHGPTPALIPDARTTAAAVPHAVRYLQRGLRQRLLAGHDGWLAELRTLTVAFVQIDGLAARIDTALGEAQEMVLAMQEAVHARGGAVQSLTMSDKGTVLYAVFGLPLLAHDDDGARAVASMHALSERLASFGCSASIGIASGTTYCGIIGTRDWRSYSVRGTVTNRAARLMAAAHGTIVVDAGVQQAALSQFRLQELEPLALKGIAEPVPAARLLRPRQTRAAAATRHLLNRDRELEQLDAALHELDTQGNGRLLVIEGNAGMGKTALLRGTGARALERGLEVLRGAVEPISLGAVYAAWASVFQTLFRGPSSADDVLPFLPDAERWRERLPLLAPVLPFDVADNALTAQMQGEVRAENTLELLVMTLERAARRRPLVILLDDCQWMDSASWRLIEALLTRSLPIVFVLAVRSEREQAADPLESLRRQSLAEFLSVGELDRNAVASIIGELAEARAVDGAVVDFVLARGSGNPYFTEELTRSLLEQGSIRTSDGTCRVTAEGDDLEAVGMPATLEQVIVSRVDRLEPDVQLTLKVASVIGQLFDFDTLLGTHPLALPAGTCQAYVDRLERAEFTLPETQQGLLAYLFRNLILHETVYELLAFAQRRMLHAAIGTWIEDNVPAAASTQKVVLAHHWTHAEQPEKAMVYLLDAGEEAFNAGAYIEARQFFQRALDLRRDHAALGDAVQEAMLLFRIGESCTRLREATASRQAFIEGLKRLGVRWPERRFGYSLTLLAHVARQLWHRLRGIGTGRAAGERRREQALAYGFEKFGHLFFFEQRMPDLMLANLCGLNFSEQAYAPAMIRKHFAENAVVLSVARAHKWAGYYADAIAGYPAEDSTAEDLAQEYSYLALYAIGHGYWDRALENLDQGIALARNIGLKRVEIDLLSFRRSTLFIRGDYAAGAAANERYQAAVIESSEEQHQYFMRIALGEFALRMAELEKAEQLFDEAYDLLRGYTLDHLHAVASRATAKHKLGKDDEAWRLAREALSIIGKTQPIGYYAMEGYAGVAGFFLDQLGAADLEHPPRQVRRYARAALKGFDVFSRSHPVARPRYLALRARFLEIGGRHQAALRTAREALAGAEDLSMPYDAAVAHEVLSCSGALGSQARRRHLDEARSGYAALGLDHEAARLAAAS